MALAAADGVDRIVLSPIPREEVITDREALYLKTGTLKKGARASRCQIRGIEFLTIRA